MKTKRTDAFKDYSRDALVAYIRERFATIIEGGLTSNGEYLRQMSRLYGYVNKKPTPHQLAYMIRDRQLANIDEKNIAELRETAKGLARV